MKNMKFYNAYIDVWEFGKAVLIFISCVDLDSFEHVVFVSIVIILDI